MKPISVPSQSKTLNDLLRKARHKTVVLESTDGRRFVLAPLEGWEAFEIGADDDITRNKRLIKHLATRRSGGKRIPLSEVKARLGLP